MADDDAADGEDGGVAAAAAAAAATRESYDYLLTMTMASLTMEKVTVRQPTCATTTPLPVLCLCYLSIGLLPTFCKVYHCPNSSDEAVAIGVLSASQPKT